MTDAPRTASVVRHSRWPGWIWALPVAALAVVGWLAVRALAKGGETVTVVFDQAAGATPGDTHVVYRGVQVGEVEKVALTPDAGKVVMTLRLDSNMKPFLRQGTRFWLAGAQPSLSDLSSLKSIVAGPTIGMRPGGGPPARSFVGLARAPLSSGGPLSGFAYVADLPGDVGELADGAPVRFRGFLVGRVTQVRLAYDAAADRLSAPATLILDPARFGLSTARGRAGLDQALGRWVAKGLRASLAKDPPLVGAAEVDLAFEPGAAPAALGEGGGVPEIPAAPAADIGQLPRQAGRILAKIDALPLEQIGNNALAASQRVRALVASPKLDQTLDHLDSTLAEVDRTVHRVGPQVDPLVASLRRAADEADAAAASARQVVAGSPTSQNADVPAALHEFTEAARSIRALADYLERHPEALIKGRKKGQP